jgi:hypothetical protein
VNFREKKFTVEGITFKVKNRQYRNVSAERNESKQNPEVDMMTVVHWEDPQRIVQWKELYRVVQ